MATVDHTRGIKTNNTRAFIAVWENLQTGDDGLPLPFSQYTDRSVQVSGDFGGGSLVIEGSNNNGASWDALSDAQGNPLNITGAKIEQILEIAALVRPRLVGGAAGDVSVFLLVKE